MVPFLRREKTGYYQAKEKRTDAVVANVKGKIWAARAKRVTHSKPMIRGWREIGGKRVYFRSGWEMKYAYYLEWQKKFRIIKDWEHEPKTFWFEGIKRGCVTYLPDFKVTFLDGTHEWIEVKGYMDAKSKTKIKRFAKYYPQERLRIVDAAWFAKNRSKG